MRISSPLTRHWLRACAAIVCLSFAGALAATGGASAASLRVIASGLDQPKKLTLAANGDLVVALSGDGVAPASCTNGEEPSCADLSGAVDEVSPAGKITTLLGDLASVSSGGADAQATGPAEARVVGNSNRVQVLFQDSTVSQATGDEVFGSEDSLLGDLAGFSASGDPVVEATFGPFDAEFQPDRGAGTGVIYGQDEKVASDPYSFVSYRGGYAVADAGANDLLFVSRTGRVSVLAVFPTIRERAAAGSFGTSQTKAIEAQAQAVPDGVAVGPDGALYVGELGGVPFDRGTSDVYRVVPGRKPSVYASGFTAIADVAFDSRGRLLVLEIDQDGLDDPGFAKGDPASGAIVRVSAAKRSTTLVSSGLTYPTGLAASRDGAIYVTDYGVSSADVGRGGEIVKVVGA